LQELRASAAYLRGFRYRQHNTRYNSAVGTTARTTETPALRLASIDMRVVLVALLGLLAGLLAYQAPPSGGVDIGGFGDRLFLGADEGLGDSSAFYADDLTPDSPTTRSRWTRHEATLVLPNLGAGAALNLSLLAQGWPQDLADRPPSQPTVTVLADGLEVARFTPSGEWRSYPFVIPAGARQTADLALTIRASDTFTSTLRGLDPRPKGVRLAQISVQPSYDGVSFLPPSWPIALQLVLAALLLYGLLLRAGASMTTTFVAATLLVSVLGAALGFWRVWAAALIGAGGGGAGPLGAAGLLLTPLTIVLGAALALSWRVAWLRSLRALVLRYSLGRALGYALVTAALAWLGYLIARWSFSFRLPGLGMFRETFPDSLLYGMLGAGLLALALVRGREGLPKLANGVASFLDARRAAPLLLALFGAVWIGYELLVVLRLPFVGHADYADNAVVARNLLRGRGWVVDYVTQFYHAYASLTRPQETWPLLQPVWIAASFAAFGVNDWAAKIPNLVFNVALLLLVYAAGAQIWSRRVGLCAAVIVLTSWTFVYMTIQSTSDLAFVVFSLAAIFTLYRARTARFSRPDAQGRVPLYARPWLNLTLSGLLTGLMVLQKPSSGLIAAGMGLWILDFRFSIAGWRNGRIIDNLKSKMREGFIWGALALLVISPYVARNLAVFGRPFFSTEQYDAWVLEYEGDSQDVWAKIYRVYSPELDPAAPGLPDRSWVLRWGFDQTLDKLRRQAVAVRDYLLPPWRGAPFGLSVLFGRDDAGLDKPKQLLSPVGAWLALAGVIAAVRARKRLLGLLGMAFTPYALFLIVYWHANEERYWVMLLPWLALLASWVLWAGYARLAAISDGRWAPLGLILTLAALVAIIQPSWSDVSNKLSSEPPLWEADLAAYSWVRANLPPDAAVMTRTPWQLNWHTERPALMIPNTANRDLILAIARRYGVRYLSLETLHRVKGDAASALAPLITARTAPPGTVIEGFTLVYASPTPDNRVLIYELPEAAQ
jgi:4-amino-4-deoxy-L-arabinose transferase-like glycosyltransferase